MCSMLVLYFHLAKTIKAEQLLCQKTGILCFTSVPTPSKGLFSQLAPLTSVLNWSLGYLNLQRMFQSLS